MLELGCGAGLLGVILHRADAAAVCLTDGDAQALHNCRHNLHINEAEVCTQTLLPAFLGLAVCRVPAHHIAWHCMQGSGLCLLLALTAIGMIMTCSGRDEHSVFCRVLT